MGCQFTKDEDDKESEQPATTDANVRTMSIEIDYKSRLGWKLCLAKDTPEPEFDLSDCMLKEIPSGVFVLCRVLRKERLKLQQNQLRSLTAGGSLSDLADLQLIDLGRNRFTRLPDDFCQKLHNLRELILSNNQFDVLPNAINKLQNLELLDVSHNRLVHINQINCMPKMRILNISGNIKLSKLPTELATCDSLTDIVLDAEYIFDPPANVLECGTLEILKYLIKKSDGLIVADVVSLPVEKVKKSTMDFIEVERGFDEPAKDKYMRERKFMEHERTEYEKYSNLEAALHQQQQQRKQELLQHLLQQQTESDILVQKVQKEKDSERMKLIDDILKAEENAGMIVDQLISLKSGPDPALIEQECEEQKQLLEQMRITHADLRKRDILAAMTELLENETKQIEIYNDRRDIASRTLLEQEINTNVLLENLFRSNDRDRMCVVSKITQNEELQKAAFATLIQKNDARMWGLVEQVRIVESQLATMTNCEIERKKLQVDERMVDLSEQRLSLTYILLDLMDQQTQRKQELLNTLVCLESQKENEQQDFWLLQYQKLMDAQPYELSFKSSSIDPMLGYNFLINGVVHCIPFLSKLWQSDKYNVNDITDADLIDAGIRNAGDRGKILKSIRDYVEQSKKSQQPPGSAPDLHEIAEEAKEIERIDECTRRSPSNEETSTDLASECVICMERTCKIIFLPCGHLCCCLDCHCTIELCPMCRASIERRIKVIQA